jgi:nucleoside-diphosphate-sugar epimerase
MVTGAMGFIGRHIAPALADAGYTVRDVDWLADARDVFRREGGKYDLVVHAAAAGANRATIDTDPLALAVNLELDAGLFRWAARTRPGRIVYLSSSAAYPVILQRELGHRLHEANINLRHPQMPDALYGWVKLTGELLAEKAREAGIPVSVVRIFSGYGADQGPKFPFGALAGRAVRREDPFTVWGTGQQVRDFIHVDDVVAAILTMVSEGIDGPVNLGTGQPTSMVELAGMFCREAGYDPVIEPKPDAPMGVAYRVADVSRMCEFYTPKITLEEGVARAMRTLCATV